MTSDGVSVAGFRAEVDAWARKIGVTPAEVRLRPMKRKWASCSTAGRLTFNLELLVQPPAFRGEAIVHELLHLKVPNHGRLFKSLFRAYAGPRRRASDNASSGP